MKFIDLSLPVKNGSNEPEAPLIIYENHEETASRIGKLFGVPPDFFPQNRWCAVEKITLGSHSGTHLDAPYHYGPISGGRPARTIDRVPLEWCFSDGVVLDFRHKKAGEAITDTDVKNSLKKIGYELKPFDIVLIMTGADRYYGTTEYENAHPGMNRKATLLLIESGIRVMGIDAWGWDRPLAAMAREHLGGAESSFWEAHYLGKEKEYCHIEKLANLSSIPKPSGFKVACFPIKIESGSAGWVRPVAILE